MNHILRFFEAGKAEAVTQTARKIVKDAVKPISDEDFYLSQALRLERYAKDIPQYRDMFMAKASQALDKASISKE